MTAPDVTDAYEPVAIADRSGFDESVHHGAVVVLGPGGDVRFAVGDPDVAIYPRSANKPIQADAMLRLGLRVDDEQLALACASHDGCPVHLAVVRRILAGAGLDERALANTPDLPLNLPEAERVLAAGGGRTPIQMNCSGKHAAMVATCVTAGWPVDGYVAPDHPLQLAITERLAELAGTVRHIGVDGCGAPAPVVALRGLASAFRTLAMEQGPVWAAMTRHPDLVGGAERDVTRAMRLAPGLMAKDGAEGVFAAASPDGRAAAVKIADGNARASGVVLAAALGRVGIEIDPTMLGEPMRGHGRPVGLVRPIIGGGG